MSGLSFELNLCEEISHFLHEMPKVFANVICAQTNVFLGELMVSNTEIHNAQKSLQLSRKSFNESRSPPKVRKISKPPAAASSQMPNTQPLGFVNQSDPTVKRDVSSLINTLVNSQTNEKIHQCTFCSYQSNYMSHAKRHVELKHLPTSVLYPCLTCGNNFRMKSALKMHYVRVHKMPDHAAKAMLTPP